MLYEGSKYLIFNPFLLLDKTKLKSLGRILAQMVVNQKFILFYKKDRQ